ncbi:transcriptional regulator, PadR family [Streptomyces sp. SceaMP-e96]|uniref:PadR family transcriptional regulator n=1 Tax=unclassified Streptomyces TaxID=2593676 RepID=UPI000823D63E|nr:MULTISPECIES: PadR family transcriptional regulator [unclassified Streptomyces]MYT13769.1 PadR family transcriptional regulator [Streptomyces sp. SID4951]SCK55560.1 transcriptional regulator, PadR family [Streptomyces sp. SceaMP-e96]
MAEFTPARYVVLGLIARHGPMTPYELKARVEDDIQPFWPILHAQLYRIPAELAQAGLLREEAETEGRRRRIFHLTAAGRAALERWLADPDTAEAETRDPAQLKLFFADLGDPADIVALATRQAERHRKWLAHYASLRGDLDPSADSRQRSRARLLRLGVLHERAHAEFWESVAADPERLDG